jgi:hypothetical protein
MWLHPRPEVWQPGSHPSAPEVRVDFFSTLESLAEIGVAITGFAGLVAVVGRRSDEPWSDDDRANLRGLLLWSLGTVFLAYVPIVLSSFGEVVPRPWQVSNAIFACFHTYVFYQTFRGMKGASRPMNRFEKMLVAIGSGVLTGEILAAAGALGPLAPSMYLVAVLWFFFLAVTRFAALVADHFESPAS